jgi:hypothetical protein
MFRQITRFGWLVVVVLGSLSVRAVCADDAQWTSMFNGKDMTGWKIAENPDSFQVQDGMIVVNGRRAHAFYVGPDGNAEFKNFHFKAQVKTTPGSNSGLYFHTKYLERGWPNRGYEAQVNNSHTDPKRTGGLYNVQDNYKNVAADDEWFDYEILVEGKHIQVKINGQTISDYTEPDDVKRPDRQLSSGTFAIQAHDPKSKVFLRELKVKALP